MKEDVRMNKFRNCFILFISLLLLLLHANASARALYFCTNDLELSKNDQRIPNYKISGYIEPLLNLNDSSNSILRHCFILLGREDDTGKVHINQSIGFGNHEIVSFSEGQAGSENFDNKKGVSCAKIKDYGKAKTWKQDWSLIIDYFDNAIDKGYNILHTNCCNVAYNSVKSLEGVNLKEVNDSSYNINYGVGIYREYPKSGELIGHTKDFKNKYPSVCSVIGYTAAFAVVGAAAYGVYKYCNQQKVKVQ